MEDNTYNLFVRNAVIKALEQSPLSMVDLLKSCHSVFPVALKSILDGMEKDGVISYSGGSFNITESLRVRSVNLKQNWRANIKEANEALQAIKGAIHLPHCLDYEWWFADNTHEILVNKILKNNQMPIPENMVFLGSPLLGSFCSFVFRDSKITILDKSASTISTIAKYLPKRNTELLCYNAEDPLPEHLIGKADFVFFDPPWYLEYYDLFLKRGLLLTHGKQSAIATILFPSLTRPQSISERNIFLNKATAGMGLDITHVEADAAHYMQPHFEKRALEQNDLSLENWRTGDMVIFSNSGTVKPENRHYSMEKFDWKEFLIGKVKVKLKIKPEEQVSTYISPKILSSTSEDAILSSVSRRSPTRDEIDLWTSTHKGIKIQGWKAMTVILNGISEDKSKIEIMREMQKTFENVPKIRINRDIDAVYSELLDTVRLDENTNAGQNKEGEKKVRKHLAILTQPFLDYILEGKKTIESRFSRVKCAPFGVIEEGDIVLLKETGGLVLGEFTAGKVTSLSGLTPERIKELAQYSKEICSDADPEFWQKRADCTYATLMQVSGVKRYAEPFSFPKKDRRGWVVIEDNKAKQTHQLPLFQERGMEK